MNGKQLTTVNEYKFLGMTFDSHLTWASHIKKVKERCQTPLWLLRAAISCNKLGADRKRILRLYNVLVRSIIDYGSIIYDTAARTHLQKIDRIQYEGIRINIGALKPSPTPMLELEANIIPLKWRKENLAIAYIIRRIIEHPVHMLYENFYPYNFYKTRSYPLIFPGRIKDIITKYHLEN